MCLIHFIPRYDAANYNCCGLCLLLALYFIFPFFVNAFHRQILIRNRDIIEDDAFSWMFVCIQPFRVRQMTVETHFRTPTNLLSTKLKYILVPRINDFRCEWCQKNMRASFSWMTTKLKSDVTESAIPFHWLHDCCLGSKHQNGWDSNVEVKLSDFLCPWMKMRFHLHLSFRPVIWR